MKFQRDDGLEIDVTDPDEIQRFAAMDNFVAIDGDVPAVVVRAEVPVGADGVPVLTEDEQSGEDEQSETIDLSTLSVPKLKAYAAANSIDLGGARTKAEILAKLAN